MKTTTLSDLTILESASESNVFELAEVVDELRVLESITTLEALGIDGLSWQIALPRYKARYTKHPRVLDILLLFVFNSIYQRDAFYSRRWRHSSPSGDSCKLTWVIRTSCIAIKLIFLLSPSCHYRGFHGGEIVAIV